MEKIKGLELIHVLNLHLAAIHGDFQYVVQRGINAGEGGNH